MSGEFAVRASDLSVHYPDDRPGTRTLAVDGVTFAVPTGGVLGILGEAGSGKSTLARTIAGYAGLPQHGSPRIHGGDVVVLGHRMRTLRARERDDVRLRVGYLPQDAGSLLDPHLTAAENVAQPIFVRDRRFDRREAGMAVATLLDAVHLPLGVMTRYPHELSRGQRQRVALARALILDPELLVADDPTMGVDVLVRGAILDVIGEIARRREFSAVVVAHEVGELRRITDQVAVMHRGMIVGLGAIDDVLASPRHPYVARISAEYRVRRARPRATGERTSAASGRPGLPARE